MKLEDWLHENRADFDQAEAPEGLWRDLKGALPQKRASKPYWAWSAAAVLLLVSALWFSRSPADVNDERPSNLPANFLAQEELYQRDLEAIEAQINLREIADNPDYQWVFDELRELETINRQYRADLNQLVPQVELLAVLIDYYEKRLRLLRRLQMEIERNQKLSQNENISL